MFRAFSRKNHKNRKIRIFPQKITETEFPKTETESETLAVTFLLLHSLRKIS